jgi:hypothetical protein
MVKTSASPLINATDEPPHALGWRARVAKGGAHVSSLYRSCCGPIEDFLESSASVAQLEGISTPRRDEIPASCADVFRWAVGVAEAGVHQTS